MLDLKNYTGLMDMQISVHKNIYLYNIYSWKTIYSNFSSIYQT